jgi:hypothetical protein
MPPHGWDVEDAQDRPVEFEIGMRWTALWRLAATPWVPAAFARMVLPADNDGLLQTRLRVRPAGPAVVQVWRDKSAVDSWARDRAANHRGPWRRFAREVGGTARWGIWHRVRARG